MSHTLQTGVVLDGPPIVVDRAAEGGPARAMARSLTGAVLVSEVAQAHDKSRLRLLIGRASDDQRAAIETAINTPGARTVYTGAEAVTAIPAERALQKFTPLVVPEGFEDADRNGYPLPAWMRQWQIELVYYRLS